MFCLLVVFHIVEHIHHILIVNMPCILFASFLFDPPLLYRKTSALSIVQNRPYLFISISLPPPLLVQSIHRLSQSTRRADFLSLFPTKVSLLPGLHAFSIAFSISSAGDGQMFAVFMEEKMFEG